MWPSKTKTHVEKSKHAIFTQENGFGPAFFHRMLRQVRGTTEPNIYSLIAMNSVINMI
jgi:hypothetical protein